MATLDEDDIERVAARVETRITALLEQHNRAMHFQLTDLKRVALWTLLFAAFASIAGFMMSSREARSDEAHIERLEQIVLRQQLENETTRQELKALKEAQHR